MIYCSMIRMFDGWFVERKTFAFGAMYAGNGAAGASIPYIMAAAFEKLGYRKAIVAWAVVDAVILCSFAYWQKPRVRVKGQDLLSFAFLWSPRFYIPFVCTIVQGIGFFLPAIYLPQFTGYAFPDTNEAYRNGTLTAMNAANILGCLVMGYLGKSIHPYNLFLIASAGSAVSVFWLFGFALQPGLLYAFAVTYGFFAGSWSVNWAGAIVDLQKHLKGQRTDTGIIYGLFLFARGLGSIVSGPLSSALIGKSLSKGLTIYATPYGSVVTVTGVTAAVGGLCFLAKFVKVRG